METKNYLLVHERFCGPPDSANGGYISGLLAGFLDHAVEVTLRLPPPLGRPLQTRRTGSHQVQLWDIDRLVAEARSTPFDLAVPEPPTRQEAEAASEHYVGFRHHFFPTCFVCGPERAEGDGLRIFPGRLAERNLVAASWTPHASLADASGTVGSPFLWAALDCPGAFAVMDQPRPLVLGRMAADLTHPVAPQRPHLVIGWAMGSSGRKFYAGTALFTEDGILCGSALQTWIELSSQAPTP